MKSESIPVIDIFSGPGGLAEGFSAAGYETGERYFEVKLSIEKDAAAHQTLELRSFFWQFPRGKAPEEYYLFIKGEITRAELFDRYPMQASEARKRVWRGELGSKEISEHELDIRIKDAIGGAQHWVLIGGPPCQAYSIAGRSRNKGVKNYKPEKDPRHFLYEEYLRILGTYWPPLFVMENVKGIISARVNGGFILERIFRDLRDPGNTVNLIATSGQSRRGSYRYRIYSLVRPVKPINLSGDPEFNPADYIIESEHYGIPQMRHRLIVIGIRDDIEGIEPEVLTKTEEIPADRVFVGLPRIRGGLSREEDGPDQWLVRLREALTRRWVRGIRSKAGNEVLRLLEKTIANLTPPKHGRGEEFIHYKAGIGYEPDWFLDPRLQGVCNSSTRAHMLSDLHRYLYAACFAVIRKVSPKLADFPADLLPQHTNVPISLGNDNFNDRFRVQVGSRPATTITSHIAKDGHYYIHPDPSQCRSLTVREAARLQTFPDNYFFCGDRTPQYVQVGNAVPPLLAKQIGEVVYDIFKRAKGLR
jgi:DNA (cytosine-5)-methyltransferase 1